MMVSALESIKVRLRQSKNNKVMSSAITDIPIVMTVRG